MRLLVLVAAAFPASVSLAAEFRAGVAVEEITPKVGYRMSGYFRERLSTGRNDPLLAKAVVFQQGKIKGAMVFCDLIGIAPHVSQAARKKAAERTGIPHANILICATHSHTGPLYFGALRNHWHRRNIATHGKDPAEPIDYAKALTASLVDVIAAAHNKLEPAVLSAGVATQKGLSFNRRFHMKDGSVKFNPGYQHPNLVRPAGPIDPDVSLLRIESKRTKKPLAVLTVFALHLDTVGGTEYSADFPFHLSGQLQLSLGAGVVSMFGAGTCGDINHLDFTKPRRKSKGQVEASRIGSRLAGTVLKQLPKLKPVAADFAVSRETITVPVQKYSKKEIAWAKANIDRIGKGGKDRLSFLDAVRCYKIMALQWRAKPTIDLETQVFRFGKDHAVVGLPGEVFVDLGLAIKKRSPFRRTYVIELCNDAPGYIPTTKAFKEGSYETVNSRIAPGGGEKLVGAAVRVLKSLKK